jgi:hypothetical protein
MVVSKRLTGARSLAALAAVFGAMAVPAGAAAASSDAPAPINGRIVFDSSRPPADIGSHLIYSIRSDGRTCRGR